MPLVLALAGLTLVLLGAAALLWRMAARRARSSMAGDFVQRQIDQRGMAPAVRAGEPSGAPAQVWRGGPKSWSSVLLRAGIAPTAGFYLRLALTPLVPAVLGWALGGPVAGLAVLLLAAVLAIFRIWLKADKRVRRMTAQVPDFLDSMVRLMTVGNSLGAAFHGAVPKTPQPLAEVIERAASLHRSGKELDVALRQVSRQYGLHELYLMAAVVGVAIRFGGRSDQVLERMAAFTRDLESARHELIAMSAEIRMSAWVLALMPLGIAVFILVFNNALFTGMWHEPVGRRLLLAAVGLQIIGSYWLYRMARLA